MDWMIDLGVSALLRVLKDQRERKKWARTIAKVFDAISRARAEDSTLDEAIKQKENSAR